MDAKNVSQEGSKKKNMKKGRAGESKDPKEKKETKKNKKHYLQTSSYILVLNFIITQFKTYISNKNSFSSGNQLKKSQYNFFSTLGNP